MEEPSNITDACRAPLSVIGADREHLASGHLLPLACSLCLHAMMFIAFSLSVFRAPAVIVTSDPMSIWLIPFIATGDIVTEAEIRPQAAIPVTRAANDGSEEKAELPQADESEIIEETTVVKPDMAEADAELMVLKRKQTKPKPVESPKPVEMPKLVEKPKPAQKPEPEVVNTASAVPPPPVMPEPPVSKPAAVEQPVVPDGVHPLAPSEVPESARKVQPDEPPRPEIKKDVAPAPPPREIERQSVTVAQKAPAAVDTRKAPVPPPPVRKTLPDMQPRRKVEKTPSTVVRTELPKAPVAGNGATKSVKKGPMPLPMPAAVPAVTQPVPAATVARPGVAERAAAPEVTKPGKPVGIVAPKVTGDIKLIVSGQTVPSLSITFREFASSRRSRPLSRAEARRDPVVVPPLVSSHDGVHHFVVVQSREGIYTISALAKDAPLNATFQLKLFEGGAREMNRNLGAIRIEGKATVVKLLMPEGIVWDDETAFTGNLEDSDSITKFNADTGLTWKEYK